MTYALVRSLGVRFVQPGFSIWKRVFLIVFSMVLLSSTLFCPQSSGVRASLLTPARLFPNPPAYIADHTGETFTVGLNISGVENLHSAHFLVAYDPVLLNVHQVSKGAFLPEDAYFYFEVEESSGRIGLNMSLASPDDSLSGGGVLAELSFEVDQAPLEIVGSPVSFLEFQLFNPNHEELDCKSVGAIFFWLSAEPSTPDGERQIDLYTQKDGIGLGEFGGDFGYGDVVTLKAYVTYADWPQQNLLVAFQLVNPLGETVLILVNATDENGIAEISFRIPEVSESVGIWKAISSVDVACEIVWDTLTFSVSPPVGGKTTAIVQPLLSYTYSAIVGILALGLIVSRRAFGRSGKHSFSISPPTKSRAQKLLPNYGDQIWG